MNLENRRCFELGHSRFMFTFLLMFTILVLYLVTGGMVIQFPQGVKRLSHSITEWVTRLFKIDRLNQIFEGTCKCKGFFG